MVQKKLSFSKFLLGLNEQTTCQRRVVILIFDDMHGCISLFGQFSWLFLWFGFVFGVLFVLFFCLILIGV